MGARTLEQILRWRLLAVAAPAFVGVGIASVVITARALDASDAEIARVRARNLLHAMHGELAEGDTLEAAMREAFVQTEGDDARAVIRRGDRALEAGRAPLPGALASLREGCASARDERGDSWRACAAADGDLEAVVAVGTEKHSAVLRTLAEAMAGIVIAVLLALVAAARLALRRPLLSLRALVDWSERTVSTDGAPPAPPAADTAEIARLTSSFDALVHRLVDALARERASSAHIAHELRTPLTAIRGELEALPSSGHDAIARMREDVLRLSRVIDAILVLSSPARPRASESVVNVADVVRELCTAETRVQAPDEALVEADGRLLELALQNLLENARKYSGHAAREVRVTQAGERVRVAVIDDGPGIDDAARARMFDRYWRSATDPGGTGLGLALVRAVAERHGGAADARPNDSGRGLEVGLTLGNVVGWHDEAR